MARRKIAFNEYELLMSQAADKMRELQEQKRDLLAACKAALNLSASMEANDWEDTMAHIRAAIQKAEK